MMDAQLKTVVAREVEPLLSECFPVPEGASFYDDFPAWRDAPGVEWLAALQEDKVVACAGWMPGLWQIPGQSAQIKVARVGGVATHPSLRGQGVGSVLVEACIDRAQRAGREAVVLWGIESPLYDRLGFRGRGHQIRMSLSEVHFDSGRTPGFLRLEEGFDHSILQLMQKSRRQFGGISLTSRDAEWIAEHKNTRWARVFNEKNQMVAYGAFGRGIDLGRQLHDWGGEGPALEIVLRWAKNLMTDAEWMGPAKLIKKICGTLPENHVQEPACLLLELQAGRVPPNDDEIWFWGLDGV